MTTINRLLAMFFDRITFIEHKNYDTSIMFAIKRTIKRELVQFDGKKTDLGKKERVQVLMRKFVPIDSGALIGIY